VDAHPERDFGVHAHNNRHGHLYPHALAHRHRHPDLDGYTCADVNAHGDEHTAAPPTFTATVPPNAPVFPETSLRGWDANDFRNELNKLIQSNVGFRDYFQGIVTNGIRGDCSTFFGYRNAMITGQAAYENVPPVWYALYYDYRILIHEAVNNVQPINMMCGAGGGTVSDEQDLIILQGLASIIDRAQALVARAAVIP
jgi:hypothetical protein